MQKYLILLLFLSGCSWIQPKQFDSTEYDYAIKTTVLSTRAVHMCGNAEHKSDFKDFVDDLNYNSMTLFEYEDHLANNEDSFTGTILMRKLIIDFTTHPSYSVQYCRHKLSEIQSSSRTLARSLGRLNKFNMCDSTVQERYSLYEKSFKENQITKEEFSELVNDITALQKVDQTSCTMEQKIKFNAILSDISKAAAILGGL